MRPAHIATAATLLAIGLLQLGCGGPRRVLVEASPLVRPYDSKGGAMVRAFRSKHGRMSECDGRGCLKRGWDECTPAHLHEAHYTPEGTVAFADTFVVPSEKGCEVVVYTDYTNDYFGRCAIVRSVCPSVEATVKDGDNGCTRELLYKAPVCEDPFKKAGAK